MLLYIILQVHHCKISIFFFKFYFKQKSHRSILPTAPLDLLQGKYRKVKHSNLNPCDGGVEVHDG